jgi:hypothetical protein
MLMHFLLLQIDTTRDAGYKIGYQVGSWLPFVFLVVLTLVVFGFIQKRKK